MKVRLAASRSDYSAIDLLQHLVLPDDVPCDTRTGHWWIATDDGEPVGFAGMRGSLRWSDCMYLCRSGVTPENAAQALWLTTASHGRTIQLPVYA